VLTALLVAACGEEAPPALTVGPVEFSESQLVGLTESRRESLAHLTALGLAVADSSTAVLGAPLVAQREEDRILEILAAELTLEQAGIAEAALQTIYETDPEWELSVRHILVFSERWRSEDHRAAAAEKARRARQLLDSGVDFPEVESRLAGEPGGEARAGLLPPGREGAWVPEFWSAALALSPGELSPVTETQYGFHVLRLEDRAVVPFAEARSSVSRRVARSVGDPPRALQSWMEAREDDPEARRGVALAEARTRGLEVPSGERAELLRVWEDRVAQWAPALGFSFGLSRAQVAEAALEALGRPGQTADVARREIASHSDLLRARYPIRLGTDRASEP